MRYRYPMILETEDLGASGTKVIDIKLLDVLSRISILFQPENGADGMSDHPAACISKIELIDGSEVLFSMSGKQAQAIGFYQMGRMPWNSIDAISGHSQAAQFDMNFGRYLWDQALAFDPKKFRNPQLRITFDETASQAATTVNKCQIWAYAFDEVVPAPVGIIRATEQYTYGLTAGGKQYVDIPREHDLREIYVRCQESDRWFDQNVSNMKLSEDSGKRVPVDMGYILWGEIVFGLYGYVMEQAQLPAVTSRTNFYTAVSDYALMHGLTCTIAQDVGCNPRQGGLSAYLAETATGGVSANIIGLLPHAVCPVLNLQEENYDNWYRVNDIGSLELIISSPSGATGGQTVEILTEQLYRY